MIAKKKKIGKKAVVLAHIRFEIHDCGPTFDYH